MSSLHCKLGSCPSGPTAGADVQQWVCADGTLVQSVTYPADRHGRIDHVKLYKWQRDGDRVDVFGSSSARGVDDATARNWLAAQGAVEFVEDWTAQFLRVPRIGCAFYEYDMFALRVHIGAHYNAHGIDMPAPQKIVCERQAPSPTKRIVRGMRRRNARRRVNH